MATKSIRPLSNRVVIKRSESPKSQGGIYLPESAQTKPKQGLVVSVGPGKRNSKGELEQMSVKEGQTVIFSSYAENEVKDENGEEFIILSENDILAVINS